MDNLSSASDERGGMSTMDDGSVVLALDAPRGVGSPMRDRIGMMVQPDGASSLLLIDNQTRGVVKLQSDGKGGGGPQVFKWDVPAKKVHIKTLTFDEPTRLLATQLRLDANLWNRSWAIQQLAAGLLYVPVAAFVSGRAVVFSQRSVLGLLYLVVFGSIVGYSAFIFAMDAYDLLASGKNRILIRTVRIRMATPKFPTRR